ncbi:MAG TPA: copper resistance protein CopC [Acidimicrobiales bacterium]|nr:copper resistance protein CopC [Acidimicrobiales bacterium]
MSRRVRALLAGALLTVVAAVCGAAPAQGHALLTASIPADGASVEEPPAEMLLTFTEALDPALSVVRVLDASGAEVEAGKAEPVPGQPAQLRVPLGRLAQGAYTASWRVTSPADGHTTVGSVAFGVGVPAVAAGTAGEPAEVRAPVPTVASVAGRWLFYVGVVLMLGAAVVGVVVVSTPAAISRRVLAAAWTASAGGVLLTINDQRAAVQSSFSALLTSSTGQKSTVQAVAVALAGIAVVWACRRPSRWSLVAVGVGASAAMLARALAGHANASSPRWFTVGMQWVHLVSVGAWVGGLVWLLVAMRRGDPGQGPGLARRFSSVAAATLAVVAVSGGVRALDEVGAWSRLTGTRFGVTLLVKLGFVAALVALGARSRFRHVRATSASPGAGLRRVVGAEVAIATGVLGATALLTGFPPSTSVAAASKDGTPPTVTVTGNDYGTSVRVRLSVAPGSAGPNRFDAMVEDYDSGEPVPAETVSLRFQLADRADVAPAMLDLTRHPDSHWRGSGTALSVDGRWTVTAVVQTATDAVEVPMELVTGGDEAPGTPSGGGGACGQGMPDPAYRATFEPEPDPPKAEGTTFHLTVLHEGRPVKGAKVCVKVDMPDMQHPGVSAVATEVSSGKYDARLRFSMTGAWEGSVTIAEPGRPAVSVPVSFEVK